MFNFTNYCVLNSCSLTYVTQCYFRFYVPQMQSVILQINEYVMLCYCSRRPKPFLANLGLASASLSLVFILASNFRPCFALCDLEGFAPRAPRNENVRNHGSDLMDSSSASLRRWLRRIQVGDRLTRFMVLSVTASLTSLMRIEAEMTLEHTNVAYGNIYDLL